MSVDSRIYIGFTIELDKDLDHTGFRKASDFVDRYPEFDEYKYWQEEKEGKFIIVVDGMNGDFARFILVDKFRDGANLGPGNEFIEMTAPRAISPEEQKIFETVYLEYTGNTLSPQDIKYAMWNQWY